MFSQFLFIYHRSCFDVYLITTERGPFTGGDRVTQVSSSQRFYVPHLKLHSQSIITSGVTHIHWNYNIHRVDSAHMRQKIADLKLDVMVYGEVGMDSMTYFLAFSRFARRSVLFWGHAVTSGIVDDTITVASNGGVNVTRVRNLRAGGPDYFVSSVLFEDTHKGGRQCAQLRYSERLLLMKVW